MAAEIAEISRSVGLPKGRLPDAEDVERRHTQLWLFALLVAVGVPAIILLLGSAVVPWFDELLDLTALRFALGGLLVAVLGYVAERERALRRLAMLLVQEQERASLLRERVVELDRLLDATHAMNSSLDPGVVLELILQAACEVCEVTSGTVLLRRGGTGDYEVAASLGTDHPPLAETSRALSRAVVTRRPVLDGTPHTGGVETAGRVLIMPLDVRGEVAGALQLVASDQRGAFGAVDLRAVGVFAETAAATIGNAQRAGTPLVR